MQPMTLGGRKGGEGGGRAARFLAADAAADGFSQVTSKGGSLIGRKRTICNERGGGGNKRPRLPCEINAYASNERVCPSIRRAGRRRRTDRPFPRSAPRTSLLSHLIHVFNSDVRSDRTLKVRRDARPFRPGRDREIN